MIEEKGISPDRRHFLKVSTGIAAAGLTASLLKKQLT